MVKCLQVYVCVCACAKCSVLNKIGRAYVESCNRINNPTKCAFIDFSSEQSGQVGCAVDNVSCEKAFHDFTLVTL